MGITTHEVRKMMDHGDCHDAERACLRALSDNNLSDDEEKVRFREMLDWAIRLRSCKVEDRKAMEEAWINQSVSFWRRVRDANPSDKETQEAYKFANLRGHKLMTERHTEALFADARSGIDTSS